MGGVLRGVSDCVFHENRADLLRAGEGVGLTCKSSAGVVRPSEVPSELPRLGPSEVPSEDQSERGPPTSQPSLNPRSWLSRVSGRESSQGVA